MKKTILICLMVGLGGCASPSGDMLSNNFTKINPTSNALQGYWSGSNGPYLVTYKFNGDGTGITCSSYNGKNSLDKFKINDAVIYMQNGLKQTILSSTTSELTLKVNYFGGATFKYSPDNTLVNASPYCEKEFKQQ